MTIAPGFPSWRDERVSGHPLGRRGDHICRTVCANFAFGALAVSASSAAPVSIVVMEGDGIGPEITAATLEVLRAAERAFKLALALAPVSIGLASLRAQGTTLPAAAVETAKAADGIILGPVSHNDYPPAAEGGLNPSGELRRRLDLFANIRPARSRGGCGPLCDGHLRAVGQVSMRRRRRGVRGTVRPRLRSATADISGSAARHSGSLAPAARACATTAFS